MTNGDGLDVKRCAKCAALIPVSATMCAYCNTTSPDVPLARAPGRVFSVRHGVSATNILIAANGAYFLFSLLVASVRGLEGKVLQWATTGTGFGPGIWLAGGYLHASVAKDGQWWRVIAATFLHYGLIHIVLNMLALRDLGRIAEQMFGTAKFVTVYLLSGIGSTLAISLYFGRFLHEPTGPLMAGASGAVFGVMGLVAVTLLRAGTQRAMQVGRTLAMDVVYMLAIGFMVPFISNTGHIGGLVVGAACGFVVHDKFAMRFDPAARRRWTQIAAVLVLAAAASLAAAAWFALTYKEVR